jgi:hypothetical protein
MRSVSRREYSDEAREKLMPWACSFPTDTSIGSELGPDDTHLSPEGRVLRNVSRIPQVR